MKIVTSDSMPLVLLDDFRQGGASERRRVTEAARKSLEEFNFVALRDSRLPASLVDEVYDVGRRFFDLDETMKLACRHRQGNGATGYMPYGTEQALKGRFPDMKEFWHTRQTLPVWHPTRIRWSAYYPKNAWPDVLPAFRTAVESIFGRFVSVTDTLLEVLAETVDLPTRSLADEVLGGPHTFRLIHYPPLQGRPREGEERAVEHSGAGVFGLLPPATDPGLEVIDRQGQWQRLEGFDGCIVVTIADMMELLTKRRVGPSVHRVRNPEGAEVARSRYAMVFFAVARPGTMLECPDGAIPAGEFLRRRMRAITLKAGDPRQGDTSSVL